MYTEFSENIVLIFGSMGLFCLPAVLPQWVISICLALLTLPNYYTLTFLPIFGTWGILTRPPGNFSTGTWKKHTVFGRKHTLFRRRREAGGAPRPPPKK